MEEFLKLEEVVKPDMRHGLLGQVTGCPYTLETLYKEIKPIVLNDNVPDDVLSQFNVTKNLAIYTWFSYSLAPVMDLKTYVDMEHALRLKFDDDKTAFRNLIEKAVSQELIVDHGFRHIDLGANFQEYSKRLIRTLPNLRNEAAHGSTNLDFNCILSLGICADFINQLFMK